MLVAVAPQRAEHVGNAAVGVPFLPPTLLPFVLHVVGVVTFVLFELGLCLFHTRQKAVNVYPEFFFEVLQVSN